MSGSKEQIRDYITNRFGYDLNRTLDEIRSTYQFDVSCQGSVPEAIIAFLVSDSYEDAIRNAISLGGDADTQAAMAGSIAEAFYGIPPELQHIPDKYLTPDLKQVLTRWNQQNGFPAPSP
jgi:ADP-ribosylglycohydrolase